MASFDCLSRMPRGRPELLLLNPQFRGLLSSISLFDLPVSLSEIVAAGPKLRFFDANGRLKMREALNSEN